MTTTTSLPAAWAALEAALRQRRPVRVSYHGHERLICPHALGWKNGRPKALVYQTAIIGPTPTHDQHGWRSLFVDEIHDATITNDPWRTAHNYTPHNTGIDPLAVALH